MKSKIDERRKQKNVNNEGRKNYRILRNELKRATEKTKKEYLERMFDEAYNFKEKGVMI
jgi:hypothetical protein